MENPVNRLIFTSIFPKVNGGRSCQEILTSLGHTETIDGFETLSDILGSQVGGSVGFGGKSKLFCMYSGR